MFINTYVYIHIGKYEYVCLYNTSVWLTEKSTPTIMQNLYKPITYQEILYELRVKIFSAPLVRKCSNFNLVKVIFCESLI